MAFTDRYVTSTGTDTYANSTNSATPMSLTTAFANAVAGDRINVKVGTYSRTTTSDTPTNAGTVTSPIWYRGYSSVIGDGNLGRTNGSGALITTNMPAITWTTGRIVAAGSFTIYESLSLSGAPANPLITAGQDSIVKSCVIVNSSTNAAATGINLSARGVLFDCDASLTGASGASQAVTGSSVNCRIISNRIKGGPGAGIFTSVGSSQVVIVGNVIFAGFGGITVQNTTNSPFIYGNTIVSATSDGINIATGNTMLSCIINNMITDNTGDGIDMVSTSNASLLGYNRTRDNTGSAVNNGGDWTTATTYSHVTTDTGGASTDYVDTSTFDYRLISTSPAKGVGYFPSLDIGALQRVEPTGSGSSHIYGG